MPAILRSGQYWADYHRRRAARLENAAIGRSNFSENSFPPLHDQAPIYAFDRTRPTCSIGTVQTNGSIVWEAHRLAASPLSGRSSRDPAAAHHPAQLQPVPAQHVAARAAAILRARPSADEQLLARLQEDPETRRHRQFRETYAPAWPSSSVLRAPTSCRAQLPTTRRRTPPRDPNAARRQKDTLEQQLYFLVNIQLQCELVPAPFPALKKALLSGLRHVIWVCSRIVVIEEVDEFGIEKTIRVGTVRVGGIHGVSGCDGFSAFLFRGDFLQRASVT
ncbi:hypothetical protein C8R43DRAFT_960997 [Mycena crocata]|nr:hypothetical protein C8R43DRAFT_960997 [Mycena crocata]